MSGNDYQMALRLQQQFEHEARIERPINNLVYSNKAPKDNTKSLVDPSWELIDPTPDIYVLFVAFNEKYFWNKLFGVAVSWSKRMTTCAGICSYQSRGGMCHITLSEPLLKLRPRKDLIETLLHEMIHAYLFVTHNNRDRDGHGPEFHKHMYRINNEAGTNITVYHDFYDEVRLYKQHWWRCNGPCKDRKPYFGTVRRAVNRAPGPNDFWWAEHQHTCGGTFVKVKEPEKNKKVKTLPKSSLSNSGKPGKSNSNKDIRSFFPTSPVKNSDAESKGSKSNIVGFNNISKTKTANAISNRSSTVVVTKKPSTAISTINSSTTTNVTPPTAFSGAGYKMSPDSGSPNGISDDYETVRNHWLKIFENKNLGQSQIAKSQLEKKRGSDVVEIKSKRLKTKDYPVKKSDQSSNRVNCPVCQKDFAFDEINLHLDNCLAEENICDNFSTCPVCDEEYNIENIEKHVASCLNKGSQSSPVKIGDLISCLVCNKKVLRTDLNSHLEECMANDNIFSNSQVINISSDFSGDEEEEEKDLQPENITYNCPVCFEMFSAHDMSGHLEECLKSDSSESDVLRKSFVEEEF